MSYSTRRSVLVAGAGFAVAGCSGMLGLGGKPSKIYVLSPSFAAAPAALVPSGQLVVARPIASQTLRTDRIVLWRSGTLDYYADAQWTDSTPALVEALLVEAFEKDGGMASVGTEAQGLHADYLLDSELRDFTARYDTADGAPLVVVGIEAQLVDATRRVVLAARVFHGEARASANSVPAAVEAFNTATAAVLGEIVDWVRQSRGRGLPAKP